MNDELRRMLSALGKYVSGFAGKGYDKKSCASVVKEIEDCVAEEFVILRKAFELDVFETCTAALGLLSSVSALSSSELSAISGAPAGHITPALCCELFEGYGDILERTETFSSDGALSRIFEGTAPNFAAKLIMRNEIVTFLTSGDISDTCFAGSSENIPDGGDIAENDSAADSIFTLLTSDTPLPKVIQICGESDTGRRTVIRRAFRKAGIPFTEIIPDIVGFGGKNVSDRVKELASKLLLLGSVPVMIKNGELTGDEFSRAVGLLSDEIGFCAAVTDVPITDYAVNGDIVTLKTAVPTMNEQYRIWEKESGKYSLTEDCDLSEITGEFSLSIGAIRKALRYADMFSDGKPIDAAMIKNGCYRSVNSDMGTKAVKINCVFGWDDIVLPEYSKKLMRAACDQVKLRHRVYDTWGFSSRIPYGRSVAMIFTGPPGTGKTMGAQIIASQLGLDIYKVDLANVVSKYIGETEKNLGEIFEKAKKSRVVLFFDEADVLFSKRTEVKDSNDKYSNMESAFLLQKIEEYNGIVILATNLVQNFDEAFKRRMKFLIDFPFPDADRRREMWKKVFPPQTPLGDIDFEFLVENYELSGSNIKNIALHSAFLAAADNEAVGMKHIIAAVKNEYSKSGKAFTKAEAGEYFYYLTD